MAKFKPNNLACVYQRFSPRPDAAEAKSLEVQSARNAVYCRDKALVVVATFNDPETSAATTPLAKREGGQALIEYVAANGICNVVALNVTRIFRDTEDGLRWRRKWLKLGAVLHFPDHGGIIESKLVYTIHLAVADNEAETTRKRTSVAMKHHQTHGRKMGSQAPFGYRFDGKLIVPDAAEHVLAELMHEMVNVLGYSMCKTAEALIEQGYDFRGKLIRHGTVRRGLAYLKAHEMA